MAATSSSTVAPSPALAPEIDHTTGRVDAPSLYESNNIYPTSGTSTTLVAGGETVIPFELPENTVCDLYNTPIKGLYTLPTNTAAMAQFCEWVPPFSRITVQTSTGTRLVDLQYAQQYFRMIRQRAVPLKEFKQRQLSDISGPCRVESDDPQAVTCIPSACPDVKSSILPADVFVSASTLESPDAPLQLRSLPAGAAAPLQIPFSLKLGELIPDSIFGLKQDMVFNERVTITFTIASQDAFTWAATSQADSQVGAVLHAAKNATLTGFQIGLLTQTNPTKRAIAMGFMKPGYMLAIPTLLTGQTSIAAAQTSLGLNIPLSGLGASEIRSVTWTIGGATGSPWRVWDFSNVAAAAGAFSYQRLSSYRTALNSLQLQVNYLNCTSAAGSSGPNTDYEFNKDGESPMTLSLGTYRQCWFHRDDFQHLRVTGDEYTMAKPAIYGGASLKSPLMPSGSALYRIDGVLLGTFPNAAGVVTPEPLLLTHFAVTTSTIRWGTGRLENVA